MDLDSCGSGSGVMMTSYEHSNEISGLMKS
jgi:hypothetical protein